MTQEQLMPENTEFTQEKTIVDDSNNHISEVVVFTDQAYVKRQINTESAIGLNRFLVEIKAFHVDRDSIQANVFGQGEILTVQYQQVPVIEAVQHNVRELDEQKRHIEQQKKTRQREKDSIHKQQKFLDSTLSYADTQIPRELKTQFPTPDNLQNILAFLDQNYKQLNEKESELEKQLEQLDYELLLVQRKLKQLNKPSQTNKQYIEILFIGQHTKTKETIKIEVFYIAGQASWTPMYKVDVPADLSLINMVNFAQIEQHTGEHWKNVKLSISNAIPLKGSKLPDLNSWRLHLTSSRTRSVATKSRSISDAMPVMAGAVAAEATFDEMSDFEEIIPAAPFAQAEQKELPLAFEFVLPQAVNIDSGDGETLLPTSSDAIRGKFFHLCMPKQDPLVYLVCEALLEKTLLPGKLNIYFAGRFVASSFLDEKQAGQELLINLGAEREVKVLREKITDKLTDSFFGVVDRLSAAREFIYRIEIENLKNSQIQMRLVDAVPVSSTDRIQMKDIKFTPSPTEKNWQDREGVMLWDLSLKAKENKRIDINFFIKYPKEDPPYEI